MAEIINEEVLEAESASPKEEEAAPKREVVFEEALEAILFAAGHPISYESLARVFDYTPGTIKNKVLRYAEKYNDVKIPRGVILLTYEDSCQLCTKQYYLHEIRETLGIKKSGTLSSSALEVLAIVAYNQPVTRVFVDTLRSVDSSYAMNSLIDRGLIESKGRLDVPGRPMLYGTTSDFLRSFGLSGLNKLPATSDELIAMFNKAKEGEADDAEQLSMLDENGAPIELTEEITNEASEEENSSFGEQKPEESSESYAADIDADEPSAEDDIVNE